MKKYRSLLMTATLLMTAQAGFAMSPSVASLQALLAAGQDPAQAPSEPACPHEAFSLRQISSCISGSCPVMGQCSWLSYLYQQGVSTCHKLCAPGSRCAMACQPDATCCEAAAGIVGGTGPAACCKVGRTAGVARCCEAGAETAQAGKCGCAKACACCESCKPTKTASSACEETCPQQSAQRSSVVWDLLLPPLPFAGQHQGPWVLPVPSPEGWIGPQPHLVPHHRYSPESAPMHDGSMPRMIAVPAPGMPMPPFPYHLVRQIAPSRNVAQAQHAHLVTPDLEAHCERMIHKGDMIMLEGEVRLVSRKNGQPVRIEAHRVLLNMKDGTYTVESDVCPARTSRFGVSRTSGENTLRYVPYGVPHASSLDGATFHGIQVFSVPVASPDVKVPAPHGHVVPVEPYEGR